MTTWTVQTSKPQFSSTGASPDWVDTGMRFDDSVSTGPILDGTIVGSTFAIKLGKFLAMLERAEAPQIPTGGLSWRATSDGGTTNIYPVK